MDYAHFGKLLVDEWLSRYNVLFLKAYFSSVNGKISSKIYHIQATLELM